MCAHIQTRTMNFKLKHSELCFTLQSLINKQPAERGLMYYEGKIDDVVAPLPSVASLGPQTQTLHAKQIHCIVSGKLGYWVKNCTHKKELISTVKQWAGMVGTHVHLFTSIQ